MVQKIIKFERIINYNNNAMLQIFTLYTMSCHENYNKLSNTQKERLLNIIYNLYLKDETKTDLAIFSDIVMNNYKQVLDGTFTINDIYYNI